MPKLLLIGAKEIGDAIGVGRGEVKRMVHEEGLPAWKEPGGWRALPEDVSRWLRERRDKFMQQAKAS